MSFYYVYGLIGKNIFAAAFKIVKTFLPEEALKILKVTTKKDIDQYVDKDNCLKLWGGNDDYEFQFA